MTYLECPHCEREIRVNISDWLYDNDLYQETKKMVPCPMCKEEFAIEAIQIFRYETAKTLGDLY